MSSSDLIVVTHPIHAEISTEEIDEAIPPSYSVRATVRIRPAQFSFRDAVGRDFTALARIQEAQWETEVLPLLAQYPNARLAYFGLAPVPLSFHLGSLVERLHQVIPFQRHHKTHRWSFAECGDSPMAASTIPPPSKSRSTQPAAVSVNVTTTANMDALLNMLGGTSCELNVTVEHLGEDQLQRAGIEAVAEEFRSCLEWIEGNRADASETHVVAAVPCGVAFALGTKLTATRHTTTVLYQHRASESPPLAEALRIPLPARVEIPLTDEDRIRANSTREEWESSRKSLVSFLPTLPEQPWFELPGILPTAFSQPPWVRLSNVCSTPIHHPIDQASGDDVAEFEFTDEKWRLGTTLLKCITASVSDHARAGRMLLLHESLHLGNQGLTADVALQIRHLPKVVEELDYQADVWAMVHEFSYAKASELDWPDARNLLVSIIRTAVSTMWAFDALNPKGELELRRVNRYLIWYANLCRLRSSPSLEHALLTLADKPCVELAGPNVVPRDGRLVMQLNRRPVRSAELGFIDDTGRFRRVGDTSSASPSDLARALGEHDGERVEDLVRRVLSH